MLRRRLSSAKGLQASNASFAVGGKPRAAKFSRRFAPAHRTVRSSEKRVRGADEKEEGNGQEETGAQDLQGKLAFEMIVSADVWRCVLEFI